MPEIDAGAISRAAKPRAPDERKNKGRERFQTRPKPLAACREDRI